MLAAEIEVTCTPSNAVPSDEMLSMLAAETDLACTPSNVVPSDEMPSMPAAETDLACPPRNVVPSDEEADFRFPPPVSFFSVYYIVEVVLILLMTFICMHLCIGANHPYVCRKQRIWAKLHLTKSRNSKIVCSMQSLWELLCKELGKKGNY